MQISVAKHIAAPPRLVFAKFADIAHWPLMVGSILSVEILTPGRIREGTKIHAKRIMIGNEITEDMAIGSFERPRRLRLIAQNGTLQYERDHLIDRSQDGSRLTLIFRIHPSSTGGKGILAFERPSLEIKLRDELEREVIDFAGVVTRKAWARRS